MPVTQSASKSLRRERRRTAINQPHRSAMRQAIRAAVSDPTPQTENRAYSAIDRAAKQRVIHRNRAARLKSRLARSIRKAS